MHKFYKFCFVLFCVNTAFAQILTGTFYYDLSFKTFDVAEEKRTLIKLGNNQYRAILEAETVGFASLFKNYTIFAQSDFKIKNKAIQSKFYKRLEKDNDEIKKDFEIIIDSKKQIITDKNNKVLKTKKGNIVDLLSIFYAMVYELQQFPQKTDFFYQTATGDEIFADHYQKQPLEKITIRGITYETVKLEKKDDPKRETRGWFDVNNHFLLLKVEHISADGDGYRYEINFNRNKEEMVNLYPDEEN